MGVATNPEDWSRPAAVKLLRKLSVADLEAWRKKMLGRVWAQLFVHGNHSLEDARAFAKLVEQQLLTTAKPGAPGDNRTRLLVKGSTTLEIAVDHDDSTLIVGYQSQKTDLVTAARYLMLGTLLGTPFFNDLRAKQQLGYIVSAHYYRFDVLPGLRFLIQSSSKDPDTLLARVDAFIAGQREAIAKLPDAEFMTVRNGLIAKLLEKHTQLYQRSGELHRNLQLRRAWDYNAQVAQQLKTFDRAAISAFYDEAVGATSARLVVRSVGRKHKVKTKPDCRTIDCASRKLRKEHKRPR